jgi:fused signal recognition particle receptor
VKNRKEQWTTGLSRTRKSAFGKIANLLGVSEITEEIWQDIEAMLIQADLGMETTERIIEELQSHVKQAGLTRAEEMKNSLKGALRNRLNEPIILKRNPQGLTIILVVGVNGAGKTTTIAKLAKMFKGDGLKVMLATTDTYRAAAIEQLQNWGQRLQIRVIAGQPGGDPGAVTYDAVQSAISQNENILLLDTAGRLHTKYNLMEELKKVHRVAGKALPGAPHVVLLVIDTTTGQNALQQAQAFKDSVQVTGVILAKLDSSARGGMAFAIQEQLHLPILFVGLGERADDLQPFDPDAFVDGILTDFG